MSNELKLDLLKERGKSLLRVIIGIIFFLIVIGWIIIIIIRKEGVKPFEWILYGLFALNGIVQFVEGLGYPFESLFGKAYIWINDEFISLKSSVFAKKQFVNWDDIQIIDYKLNKFIIEKTDNTILIIDLSKFEYIVNMEIKKVIFDIAKEKNIQIIREPFNYTQWQKEHYAGMSVSELNKKAVEYAKNNPLNLQ